MQIDKTHDKILNFLYQKIGDFQSSWIFGVLYFLQARYFLTVEAYVLVYSRDVARSIARSIAWIKTHFDFKFPTSCRRRLPPMTVVDLIDIRTSYDSFQLIYYGWTETNLSSNDAIVLVVAIVCVS